MLMISYVFFRSVRSKTKCQFCSFFGGDVPVPQVAMPFSPSPSNVCVCVCVFFRCLKQSGEDPRTSGEYVSASDRDGEGRPGGGGRS